jgi:hypothetical protein
MPQKVRVCDSTESPRSKFAKKPPRCREFRQNEAPEPAGFPIEKSGNSQIFTADALKRDQPAVENAMPRGKRGMRRLLLLWVIVA